MNDDLKARIARAIAAATPAAEPEPPAEPERKRRAARRPTLATAYKQALKAGAPVSRIEIDRDGRISLTIGEPGAGATNDTPNPWTRKYAAH